MWNNEAKKYMIKEIRIMSAHTKNQGLYKTIVKVECQKMVIKRDLVG